MFQKIFRKNTESFGDANSQKDYLEYCKSIEQTLSQLESGLHTGDSPEEIALFHRGLPDMAKSQIQTAKNYLTEDEYSDLVKHLAQRPDVPAGFQLQ